MNQLIATDSPFAGGRVARRRARVRERLLEAAERLMLERGVERVTIDDITEAADIARRSFYHHFESKHALLVPIAHARTKSLNRRIDRLVGRIDDPVAVLATGFRHGLRAIASDPLCRWFVLHSGLPHDRIYEAMGESGMRDVKRGIDAGRLHVSNPAVASLALAGAFVAVLRAHVDGQLTTADLDDAATSLLLLLGVDRTEAERIAHERLHPLPPDPEE